MKITHTQEQEIKEELNDFRNRLRREGESLLKRKDTVGHNYIKHSKKISDLLETL